MSLPATQILNGYPAPPGSKKECVVDITGPASYTAITLNTTVTGGDSRTAHQLGIQGLIEGVAIESDGSDSSGNFWTVRKYLVPNPTLGQGPGAKSVVFQWMKNGTEVTTGQSAAAGTVRIRVTAKSY